MKGCGQEITYACTTTIGFLVFK